jgi:hypothetical protein
MRFRQGLAAARGSLLMIAALTTGLAAITAIEHWQPARKAFVLEASAAIPAPPLRPLTGEERRMAQIAWRYFENGLRPETGLVDSADRYPATTLWDTGSYLMALIAAERLRLVDRAAFDSRASRALQALSSLTLYEGDAPNKSYNTLTLAMVDYNNQPTPKGIGWSAIDVGRLLVPLHILVWRYPQHTAGVRAVLERWHWDRLVHDGLLYGAAIERGRTVYLQEGRLGYEEYGAKAYSLAGLDVRDAVRVDDFLTFVDVDGVQVPTDSRRPEEYGSHNAVVSEPYLLDGLEFGFDRTSREFAWRVEQAQEARFRRTGVLTAVSEDNIDTAPFFVYNAVFNGGRLWSTVSPEGADASAFRSLSTKAAIGWDALYATPYTRQLAQRVATLADPGRGWYSGLYEVSGKPNTAITANTNAIVLESLCYVQYGPLLRPF